MGRCDHVCPLWRTLPEPAWQGAVAGPDGYGFDAHVPDHAGGQPGGHGGVGVVRLLVQEGPPGRTGRVLVPYVA